MSSSIRTFHLDRAGTSTGSSAMEAKDGRTVSVCIPCRDEAATIGPLVTAIRDELVDGAGFVDELIVLDDRSTDDTATVAAHAGARVVSIDDVHASYGVGRGKGNALWASLLVSSGDVVVWCDGDVTSLEPEWIQKLALPIFADDTVALVKALYDRPTSDGGGGRTTELVARPMLSRWFPELAEVAQPLAGEYAVRRSVVERLTFEQGWGVEVGLLIDVARTCGVDAVGQV
ncbi:MAG: glucosyl-3-phosphoglycerate synthase, partial [Actinomycetota bacterium]